MITTTKFDLALPAEQQCSPKRTNKKYFFTSQTFKEYRSANAKQSLLEKGNEDEPEAP